MGTVPGNKRARPKVGVGAPDPSLTECSGMAAVSELCDRLDLVAALDTAVGPIKTRDRGVGAGGLLVGLAAAQLAGQDHLVGLDRHRDDAAGQELTPVPGLGASTATGLAQRITGRRWQQVEGGVATASARMLGLLPAARVAALTEQVTIDIDATDVEVYGRHKHGVAYNYQGQRAGRPHVASWAETGVTLAADLLAGDDDPRPDAAGLLGRALAGLEALPGEVGRVALRADAGYFAAELATAAHQAGIGYAIGAKRIPAVWNALAAIAETDWTEAIDMPAAEVAVAGYRPGPWPGDTRLLVRRVRLEVDQISTDPRSRRRRTLHPDQRSLPLDELAAADAVYAYSFVLTNLDVSTPQRAAAVEHWYRHRTAIENVFRDSKHGAALRHLPSGHQPVNTAWMWGALLAATMAGWLHQLTLTPGQAGQPVGLGVRGGQAMIATLRRRLIRVPARLVRHAGALTLRPPPGHDLLEVVLDRLRALPAHP